MQTIVKATEMAESASSHAGVQLTPKRRNLLALLLRTNLPLSAYELADYYKDEFDQAIPPMSVYRMLDFLTENNLVHKLSSENKFVSCAHSTCKHVHEIPQFLICEKCHSVKEIGIPKEVFDVLAQSVDQAGYSLQQSQLELKCLCAECAKT